MGVGHQGGQDIDHGVDNTAMSGVLDLLDVFNLVVDGFDDGSLAQQQLIHHRHPFVLPVSANFGDQLQAPLPEFVTQAMGNVAAIADQLAGQTLSQLGYRFAIIHVTGGDAKGQEFAPVIDHPMELEPVEPAHRRFPPAGDLLEDRVAVNAAVVAHHQRGGIDEGNSGILAPAGVEIDAHRQQGGGNQGHKPIVAQKVRKLAPTVPAQVPQVKGFEIAVLGLMEISQDRHDLAESQPRGSLPLARAARQELAMPGRQEPPAKIIDVAVQVF